MAKLSAHGTELARRETPTARIAVMSDGHIMKNYGSGWKIWKHTKPGVDVVGYAAKFDARSKAIMPEVRAYIETLIECADLEHRARLHNAITLMPNDPDGIWSEFDDYSGYSLEIEDIIRCCRAYQVANDAVKEPATEEAEVR